MMLAGIGVCDWSKPVAFIWSVDPTTRFAEVNITPSPRETRDSLIVVTSDTSADRGCTLMTTVLLILLLDLHIEVIVVSPGATVVSLPVIASTQATEELLVI